MRDWASPISQRSFSRRAGGSIASRVVTHSHPANRWRNDDSNGKSGAGGSCSQSSLSMVRGTVETACATRACEESQICVLSSRTEGGANVLSEAIVEGVPILASRIDGNIGILGDNYPGLFDVGNTRALAGLLLQAETDPEFLNDLRRHVKELAPLFNPQRERRAWADLLGELHCG